LIWATSQKVQKNDQLKKSLPKLSTYCQSFL
jgi:hypothetical protein